MSPNPSPEMGTYSAPEAPRLTPQTSEVVKATPEKLQPNTETASVAPPQQPAQAVKSLPQLPNLPQPKPLQKQTVVAGSNPLVAADEDLIEKEWVDKAKKIVSQTKEDPYSQEKEVSKLQADYLKKRYGKEIKLSSE